MQIGYGRTGPGLWRFAQSGVVPDLVTLGKPMGAGYPVGAVVTRRELVDRFAERYEYFSTFAATPAAAAAGNAVLDVLEDRRLPERALVTGAHLLDAAARPGRRDRPARATYAAWGSWPGSTCRPADRAAGCSRRSSPAARSPG